MTDGRDETDGNSAGSDPGDRRGREWPAWPDDTEATERQQRHQRGERTNPQQSSGSRAPNRQTDQSRDRQPHQPEEPLTARTGTIPEPSSVHIDDDIGGDDDWVDLGEQRPEGETLGASDLSEAELLEYTTDRRSLHPLVQVHWGIRITIGVLIVGLLSSWALPVVGVDSQFSAAVVGVLLLLGLVWVLLYYRLWVYQIRADAIYLERGVVTHVRSLVPYVRIQHVDTSRSPIERMLGLSTLVVYTAGSRGADVSIPGLLPEEARDMQRRVKELAIEAEGDDAL